MVNRCPSLSRRRIAVETPVRPTRFGLSPVFISGMNSDMFSTKLHRALAQKVKKQVNLSHSPTSWRTERHKTGSRPGRRCLKRRRSRVVDDNKLSPSPRLMSRDGKGTNDLGCRLRQRRGH